MALGAATSAPVSAYTSHSAASAQSMPSTTDLMLGSLAVSGVQYGRTPGADDAALEERIVLAALNAEYNASNGARLAFALTHAGKSGAGGGCVRRRLMCVCKNT